MKKPFLIGIGNPHRGDDAAGLLVLDRLKNDFESLKHDGEPAALIDAWQGHDDIILVDAVSSGAGAGEIFELDLQKESLPDIFAQSSTHSFGVAEAVELARALGKLPPAIFFYGIAGENFSIGGDVSPEVEKSVAAVAQSILDAHKEKKHA